MLAQGTTGLNMVVHKAKYTIPPSPTGEYDESIYEVAVMRAVTTITVATYYL